MKEATTRIQWGPTGITVYTDLGMHSKYEDFDEMRLFTQFIANGFDAVDALRQQKAETEKEKQ